MLAAELTVSETFFDHVNICRGSTDIKPTMSKRCHLECHVSLNAKQQLASPNSRARISAKTTHHSRTTLLAFSASIAE